MELVKNIFFNTDKLTPNITVKISYTGKFFQDQSEKVLIHYGFDSDWKNSADIDMNKTELGFQAEILLQDAKTLNFCFKNNKDEWDNNNENNFIFEIEHPELALVLSNSGLALSSPKKLRKAYIIKKKLKISVYKLLTYLPKLVKGNYRKKENSDIK